LALSRIVVTGMGIISSIGEGLDANRMALKEGRSGISTLELFPSKFSGVLPCGEIKIPTTSLREILQATESGLTRTTLQRILPSKRNWDAGWSVSIASGKQPS
jgi:3-oxoacyl-(acyl-carrier-protein) synthase